MSDKWLMIDDMVSELGDLYALEVEASAFPELSADPIFREVHFAVLRATDAMSRVASATADPALKNAREALDSAAAAAAAARRLLVAARASRNRHV
jgi:hypothetical protein